MIMRILRGETCTHCQASDGLADPQSLDAETSPSVNLYFFASMAGYSRLHVLGMLIFSIRL